MYTVKQLSSLAGVSPRTLHYYDQIGLLKPDTVRENGYRYYGEAALLQLQQVLFYRELGLSLAAIKTIVMNPDFDLLSALESHHKSLLGRAERLERLIQTVDDTIMHLKGKKEMSENQLFEAFSEEQQEEYAQQAEKMYDPITVRESNRKWKSYSSEKKQKILAEGNQVYVDMIAAMPKGPDSPDVQLILERWRQHMDYFWTPSLDQLLELAEGYNTDSRFKANFDKMHTGLAEFMREAMEIYVKRRELEGRR